MCELHTQIAILFASSGLCGDVLPSPFSKGGKEWPTSISKGIQWNEAFDESINTLQALNWKCLVAACAPAPLHMVPKGC